MLVTAGAFLIVVAQGSSVLAALSDREYCAAFNRNLASYAGQTTGPATVETAVANCRTKRVQLGIQLSVEEQQRDSYINVFMNAARAGVCSTDPTMVTFWHRGWKFEYSFLLPAGRSIVRTVNC